MSPKCRIVKAVEQGLKITQPYSQHAKLWVFMQVGSRLTNATQQFIACQLAKLNAFKLPKPVRRRMKVTKTEKKQYLRLYLWIILTINKCTHNKNYSTNLYWDEETSRDTYHLTLATSPKCTTPWSKGKLRLWMNKLKTTFCPPATDTRNTLMYLEYKIIWKD
jgi:hypothetical protein